MAHRHALPSLAVVLLLLLALAGCGGKGKLIEDIPTAPAEPTETPSRERPEPDRVEIDEREPFPTEKPSVGTIPSLSAAEWNRQGVLRTVYFGFDSFGLSPSARETLQDNAEWLKAHPEYKVLIQGHCDERGTIEYNLALGEKRASAVRDYLTSLGLRRANMRIVTFGEERPVAPGHDESAWSQNRRAEFVVEE